MTTCSAALMKLSALSLLIVLGPGTTTSVSALTSKSDLRALGAQHQAGDPSDVVLLQHQHAKTKVGQKVDPSDEDLLTDANNPLDEFIQEQEPLPPTGLPEADISGSVASAAQVKA